jgi:hypothetical protein
LIIDNERYEYIIDKHTTNKLKLSLESHHNPYKIKWIKLIVEIKVTQYYKVFFFYGKV